MIWNFYSNQQHPFLFVYPFTKSDSGYISYHEYSYKISLNASSIPSPVNADTL